jgi:hypothetical protein
VTVLAATVAGRRDRWDSGNYLKIAGHGYSQAHCVPKVGNPFTAADWCGTVGWFPLYPLAMRLVGALGLGAPRAGLLLAELFALGSLSRAQAGLDLLPTLGRAVQTSSPDRGRAAGRDGLQQAETGRWDGFLLVEAKYGTGLHNPADTFEKNAVRQAPPPGADPVQSLAGQVAPRDQFRLVTVVALVAVGAILTAGERTPLDLAVLAAV